MEPEMHVHKQSPMLYQEIKLDKYQVSSLVSVIPYTYYRHLPHSTLLIVESVTKLNKRLLKR